jgi:hypothetical protein
MSIRRYEKLNFRIFPFAARLPEFLGFRSSTTASNDVKHPLNNPQALDPTICTALCMELLKKREMNLICITIDAGD